MIVGRVSESSLSIETLGLTPEAVDSLPDGLRRQVVRFFLRWRHNGPPPPSVLDLLPEKDPGPLHRFDRCCALLAAGRVEAARDLARELVNTPEAGRWGHMAVAEVFLALEKPHRADERFRAAADLVGRARAHLMLGEPATALKLLPADPSENPEIEAVRLEALRRLGEDWDPIAARLRGLLEAERAEVMEALGTSESDLPSGPPPTDAEGLRAALKQVFGYDDFRGGQLEVIQPLMRGESVLGLMPTGAGKSICFQLPAALLGGATVVISPLIALMKDQVDGLPPALYRRATLINSALEPGEAERRMERIARGQVSLIYAAPERLRQRGFVRALERRGVSLFVIDEAHCVSLWGHDFRPDYFFIRQVLRDLGRPTVLALTATATPEMQADIGRQLDVPLQIHNLGTFRPNLQFEVHRHSSEPEKWEHLLRLVRSEKGAVIIYANRRKLVEELAEKLRAEGIPAEGYHAGLDKNTRDRVQSRFMLGEIRVMAATVAFGMGVDKADVRLVVHYNLARSLEAYYQEAGRAGRDGLPARCVLLYTSYDKSSLTRLTNQDRLDAAEILRLHQTLSRRLRHEGGAVPMEELVGRGREQALEELRVRVAISLLEGVGVLERGYDLPGNVWLARLPSGPQERGDEAFAAGGEEARFLKFAAAIWATSRTPVSLPATRVAAAAGVPVEHLELLLSEWQEANWLRFRTGGRGMGLTVPPGRRDLTQAVNEAVQQMLRLDERRLAELARYLDTPRCRQAAIGAYFGAETLQECGVCDNCRRGSSLRVRSPRAPALQANPAAPDPEPISDEESALFERLRAWRREKAREDGLPAYCVLHDRTLYAIARARPVTLRDLSQVHGMGTARLQNYGDDILNVVLHAEPPAGVDPISPRSHGDTE